MGKRAKGYRERIRNRPIELSWQRKRYKNDNKCYTYVSVYIPRSDKEFVERG